MVGNGGMLYTEDVQTLPLVLEEILAVGEIAVVVVVAEHKVRRVLVVDSAAPYPLAVAAVVRVGDSTGEEDSGGDNNADDAEEGTVGSSYGSEGFVRDSSSSLKRQEKKKDQRGSVAEMAGDSTMMMLMLWMEEDLPFDYYLEVKDSFPLPSSLFLLLVGLNFH